MHTHTKLILIGAKGPLNIKFAYYSESHNKKKLGDLYDKIHVYNIIHTLNYDFPN